MIDRRCRGAKGSALVTALVLLFAFTAGGVIWLSRDVNRRVTNRSAAQSIAFQAARSGAQQVVVGSLRSGDPGSVTVDDASAREQARRSADRLLDEYSLDGEVVDVTVEGRRVTVEIIVRDPVGDVTGVGSAEARTGP